LGKRVSSIGGMKFLGCEGEQNEFELRFHRVVRFAVALLAIYTLVAQSRHTKTHCIEAAPLIH
jgi:hypothetical protein